MSQPHETSSHQAQTVSSPFWPQFLLGMSLTIFLGWQTTMATRQYFSMVRLSDQQSVLVEQAAAAENKFQGMMTELIKLSTTDADAKAIVTKYRITLNNQGMLPNTSGSKTSAIKEAIQK